MAAVVVGVSCDRDHRFSKPARPSIALIAGLGVEGDAHAGATVQHLSRIKRDPTVPNWRQVHLIRAELHDELAAKGFAVGPGDMGENVTTRGVDLLGLPVNARLRLGPQAIVEVKGLRNPCGQLNGFQARLMAACLEEDASGKLIRKAGIMGIVLVGGVVKPGDPIWIDLPNGRHEKLGPV